MPTPTLSEQNRVRRVLVDLTACLKAQIEDPANGLTRPCAIAVVPGEAVLPEYQGDCDEPDDVDQPADCGLAWVRLVAAYPAEGVGVQKTTVPNCGAEVGLTIQMGITHCIQIPDDPRNSLSEEDLFEVAMAQVADMLAMRKAITCCSELDSRDYILGNYNPIGPAGELVGGSWTITTVA